MAHKIIVKNEHFKNCESYSSNTHCPLALAIKEQLPELKNLWVGGTIVKLDEKQFYITANWSGNKVIDMIINAKRNIYQESIEVILTEG
jgi:hypothetical protein